MVEITSSAHTSGEPNLGGIRPDARAPTRAWFAIVERSRALFAAPAMVFLVAVFVCPLLVILAQSFYHEGFTFRGYAETVQQKLFWRILWTSLEISVEATVASLLLAYPIALFLSQLSPGLRALGMTLVLVPFWTSILVKSFAFVVILGERGIVKTTIASLFGIQIEASLLFNRIGVIIGMTHYLIPFIVFPVLTNLLAQSPALRNAAALAGASRLQIFWRVTFPLSLPAVIASTSLVAVLALGAFAVPSLLGGRSDMMISNLVDYYTREILDWNQAASLSVILVVLTGAIVWLLSRFDTNRT